MSIKPFHRTSNIGRGLVESEIHSKRWKRVLERLPVRDDIIRLLVSLEEVCQFHDDHNKSLEFDYSVWSKIVRSEISKDDPIYHYLVPSLFWRLPKTENGKIALTTFVTVIARMVSEQGLFASLAACSAGDPACERIVSIDGLEDWLFQQSHRLYQIQKMTEQFLPLWVFTAAHTVAFFHGYQRASRPIASMTGGDRLNTTSLSLKIADFVKSDTMKRLLELSKPVLEDMESNPFSRMRAVRYYDSFTVFDAGRNAESSPSTEQCSIFAGGYMNPAFMDRLMEIHGGPAIDYRRFLTFAIAWDNRKTEQGVKYFWPLVDKQARGYMSDSDLSELVNGILLLLRCLPAVCGPQGPKAPSVLADEIRDIVRTHSAGRLDMQRPADCVMTKADALASPDAFGSIIGILGNTQTFIEYECREDTAHKLFLTRQVKEARTARMKAAQATRGGQLSILQQLVDECWFYQKPNHKFGSFAEFLDYHEATYGGESMEPWLVRYYQWEQQEAENCQILLSESQFAVSEADSVSVIQKGDDEHSVAEPSELIEPRE